MTHDPIEELLGAYALNAVDEEERRAVDAHLAQSGAPAPEGLWERIAGAIEAEAPPLRLVVDDGARTAGGRGARRPRWQRTGLAVLATAAAVAVIAVAVTSLVRVRELEDAGGIEQAALEAVAAPEARVADLVADDGSVVVRAAVLPDGTSYLFADDLPDLEDRIYQLWGAAGDQVVSLGPLGSAPTILPFHADPTMTTFMITIEEEPVERSANPAIAIGELS